MTCEDMYGLTKVNPLGLTVAVRATALKHLLNCQSCVDRLWEEGGDKEEAGLTDKERVRLDSEVARQLRLDFADPEGLGGMRKSDVTVTLPPPGRSQ